MRSFQALLVFGLLSALIGSVTLFEVMPDSTRAAVPERRLSLESEGGRCHVGNCLVSDGVLVRRGHTRRISVREVQRAGSLDPEFAARSAPIPNLRAIDFAGKAIYCAALLAFLAATLLTYFVLCKISPTILLGWAQVSGAPANEDLAQFVDSVNYPLYIAAAFIGFTQPGIPLLSNIGNVQRDLFHAWMGVPRRVMSTSSSSPIRSSRGARMPGSWPRSSEVLVSDDWVGTDGRAMPTRTSTGPSSPG